MVYLLIYRAERFSPNAVERDKAMMDAVARNLRTNGRDDVVCVREEDLRRDIIGECTDCTIIHMARSEEALGIIEEMEEAGARVLNSPKVIRRCNRAYIEQVMTENGLPTPSVLVQQNAHLAGKGWWVKSVETTDSSPEHIRFSKEEVTACAGRLVQPHIEGTLVKFYGVLGTGFFHTREEMPSGAFCSLKHDANTLANALGLDIYGGDAILTDGGLLTIIDFNDFPSFGCCREEAAKGVGWLIRN